MAFITVSDAAGRVLFRRRATESEMADAVRAAEEADAGAEASMQEIAEQRYAILASGGSLEQHLEPPDELAELEDLGAFSREPEFEEEPVMAQAQTEPEAQDPGLFGDDDLDDSWFGDARFSEEEIAS